MAVRRLCRGLSRCFLSTHHEPVNHRVTSPLLIQLRCVDRQFSTSVVGADGIVSSPHKDMDLPVISFGEHFFECTANHRDKIAIESVDSSQKYTYSQLQDAVVRVGSALTRMGYKKGDTIFVAAPNSVEYMIIFLAIGSIGCVNCCMNVLNTTDMLKSYLRSSGSSAIVTTTEFLGNLLEACAGNGNIRNIITLDGPAEKCRPFASLLEDDGRAFQENQDISPKDHPLMIFYSSGTTGLPKGVLTPHYATVSNIRTFKVATPPAGEEPIALSYLPLYHLTGNMVDFLYPLYCGTKIVVARGFDPNNFFQWLEHHRITDLLCVPPILLYMVKHPALAKTDLSSLCKTIVGGAPCGADISREYMEKVGHLVQGYGMTEVGVTHIDSNPVSIGSIGSLFPNYQAKVVSIETGASLGPGEEGELCMRGPFLMIGYHNNSEATEQTIKKGWLHSGDIGKYDEQGKFYITDRLKELIKYKAFQVAPAELEGILVGHPGIRDAAVIGRPDDEAGEIPMAFVVLQPDVDLSEKQIQDYVAGRVAPYEKLRGGVVFTKELPKSPTGKLLRRILKEQVV